MKTLLLVSISLFAMNVMASTGHNCAAQMSSDRDRLEKVCGNTTLSNEIKLGLQCPASVKAKAANEKATN